MRVVEVAATDGGDQLLTGGVEIEIDTEDGTVRAVLALPPGAPERPVTDGELRAKLEVCAGPEADADRGAVVRVGGRMACARVSPV